MTFEQAKANIINELENRNIVVEQGRDGSLCFSLIELGLSGVYATVTKDEIQYQADNVEEDVCDHDYENLVNGYCIHCNKKV